MNFRTTVILLVLLVGAFVFLLVARDGEPNPKPGQQQSSSEENDQNKGRQLFTLKADDISRVVIAPGPGSDAKQTIDLVRERGEWKLVRPVAWPASKLPIESFVSTLIGLRSRGQVDLTPANAATLGLDKPRFTLELYGVGGAKQTLAIGKRRPLGSEIAVIFNGESTGSLTLGGGIDRMDDGIEKLLETFRDPALVRDVLAPQVTRAEITGPDNTTYVLERPASQWQLVSPLAMTADNERVNELLSMVTNLSATAFVESPSADVSASFEQPTAVFKLWTGAAGLTGGSQAAATQPAASQPTTAATTRPAPRVVAVIAQPVDIQRREAWVCVGAPGVVAKAGSTAADFDRLTGLSINTLRDRRLFPDTPAEKVTAIRIEHQSPGQPTTQTVLTRKPEPTPATQPAATPATQPAAAPSQPASTQPATSQPAAAASPSLLQVGSRTMAAIWPTTLLQVDEPATTRPTATQPAATTQPKTPQTRWLLGTDGAAEANDAATDALVETVVALKATKYIDPTKAASQPTTQPVGTTFRVTLVLGQNAGPTAERTLTITDPGEGKPLIGTMNGLTFELDRSLLAKLTRGYEAGSPPPEGAPFGPPGGMGPMNGLPPGMDPHMFMPPTGP